MTVRAIAGLLLLDLALVVPGAALLFGFRGLRSWAELLRLAGLAFLLGFAAVATVLTALLAIGVPFGPPAIVTGFVLVSAVGVALGIAGKRPHPLRLPVRPQLPQLSFVTAFFLAAFALYFEALFRATRIAPRPEWDAWHCWALRPKAIWYFDGFDPALLGTGPTRCPGYPPGLATIEASAFETMGSADVVTYGLQHWVLALAFVGAVVGLLAPRVRSFILLPFLLLVVVLPSVTDRIADGRADLPLAYLVGVAGVLLALWLGDQQTWRLPTATVLLGAAVITKREGLLFVACVIGASLVASCRHWRFAWPRLVAVGLAASLFGLPWRLWLAAQEATTGAPTEGYLGLFDDLDRAWPSLRLVTETIFDHSLWSVAVPLALLAVVVGVVAGAFREAVFLGALLLLSVAAASWAIWVQPHMEFTQDFGLNPVIRLVGGPVVAILVLVPLLLGRAWTRSETRAEAPVRARRSWRAWLPWTIVLVAALGYPLSALTGFSGLRLPGSLPRFPSVDECVVPPGRGEVRVVLGYVDRYPDASTVRARGISAGVRGAEIGADGCGRLRVYVDGIDAERGRALVGKLEDAGLDASLEGIVRT